MAKTKAAEVMRAAERAQRAERRVGDAERAYAKAVKSRDRAEAIYLRLVTESVSSRLQAPATPSEGIHSSE
jgi:hypothetical protein